MCTNRRIARSATLHASETIRTVTPSALGCEECLKIGLAWVHLRHLPYLRPCRLLRRLAEPARDQAFPRTGHPIIEGYDPPEGWGWCYVDEMMFDLSDRMTPHNGPIPRYY